MSEDANINTSTSTNQDTSWKGMLIKLGITCLSMVGLAAAGTVTGFFEQIFIKSDIEQKEIANEDSLRRHAHKEKLPQGRIETYHLRVDKELTRDTSLLLQTLLVRMSGKRVDAPDDWEEYNRISILYEYPFTYRFDNKKDWQNVNIDDARPGIRTFLKGLVERGYLYTWVADSQTPYDSIFVPDDVRQDYLYDNNIEVILYEHMGFTRDRFEHWFVQTIVSKKVWSSARNRRIIRSEIKAVKKELQDDLGLYNKATF